MDNRRGVVGDLAVTDVAGNAFHVVDDVGNDRHRRRGRVRGSNGGWLAGILRCVGGGDRENFTVQLRRVEGDREVAAVGGSALPDDAVAQAHGNGAARFGFTAEDGAVFSDQQVGWGEGRSGVRRGGIRGHDGGRNTRVARRIGGHHAQDLAVVLDLVERDPNVAVGIRHAVTHNNAVVVGDNQGTARLGAAGDFGACFVDFQGRLIWRGAIDHKLKGCRRGAGVTRQIGLGQGDRVRAFRQRIARGKAPVAVGVDGGLADHLAVVIQGDGAARFAAPAQLRLGGVGGGACRDRAQHRAGGVIDRDARRGIRGGGINRQNEAGGFRTHVARAVGGTGGDGVDAFTEIAARGECPAAVAVHQSGADSDAVIVYGDGRAGLAGAGEARAGIISGLAAGKRSGNAACIIAGSGNQWRTRRSRVRCGDAGTWPDVARAVGRRYGQGFPVVVRGTEINGEFAVAVGSALADDVTVGIGNGYQAVGFGGTGKLLSVCGEAQVAGGTGRGSIGRDGIRVADVVIAIATAPATATAYGQRNAACDGQPADHPRPGGKLAGGCCGGSCQQDVKRGDGLVMLHRQRIGNPPQCAVVLFQHQLADAVGAVSVEVFERNGFTGIEPDNQVIIHALIPGNIGPSCMDLNHRGVVQRDQRPLCYRFLVRQFRDDCDFAHRYDSHQSATKWRNVQTIYLCRLSASRGKLLAVNSDQGQ
ncbi:hypothetical protein D3C75_366300 [compost metagenome]